MVQLNMASVYDMKMAGFSMLLSIFNLDVSLYHTHC